jgi:hypothetical protein
METIRGQRRLRVELVIEKNSYLNEMGVPEPYGERHQ